MMNQNKKSCCDPEYLIKDKHTECDEVHILDSPIAVFCEKCGELKNAK